MIGYIGHTAPAWWRFQRARPPMSEVNFWRPGGTRFAALAEGEPFFFRIKAPVGLIGGFGTFATFASLPIGLAWDLFDEANGTANRDEFVALLAAARRQPVSEADVIGCIAVTDCVFFDDDDLVALPESFDPRNLSGSRIDLASQDGSRLWADCNARAGTVARSPTSLNRGEDPREGAPSLRRVRLGQASFRVVVLQAYEGRCAISGEGLWPSIEAGHIRPWAEGGVHDVCNGLPLRRDLHHLFDRGFISVAESGHLLVSEQLQTATDDARSLDWLTGRELARPVRAADLPAPEALRWHREMVFRC